MSYRKTARFLPFVAFFGLSVGSILSAPASVVAQSLQATLENSNLQRFAGKATRAGDIQRDGSVKFEMRLDASSLSGLDLTRLPFLHFADLLLDTDGTSLVSTDYVREDRNNPRRRPSSGRSCNAMHG